MEKFRVYVDETGKDHRSNQFIVTVAVIPENVVDDKQLTLADIETESKRNRRKWANSKEPYRRAYFEQLIATNAFADHVFATVFPSVKSEIAQKCETIANALLLFNDGDKKCKVFIDGSLSRSETRQYRNTLRKLGVQVAKVKGVSKQSADNLQRFVDACCGLIRANEEGYMTDLYRKAVSHGVIHRI